VRKECGNLEEKIRLKE
jgi:hypothetical protein